MVISMTDPEATVLYDEDCGFCKWSLDKILAWDRSHKLRPVPIQSEEGQRLLATVPEERRLDSWHMVDAEGERALRWSGGSAAVRPHAGRTSAWLAAGRAFPRATERAYRAVAGNRDRLARLLRIDASCQVRR